MTLGLSGEFSHKLSCSIVRRAKSLEAIFAQNIGISLQAKGAFRRSLQANNSPSSTFRSLFGPDLMG
jgi:hypothetical protein